MARTSSINFTENSRNIKVTGECTTTNLRMDVAYEKDGVTGAISNINGQVYRKEGGAYAGNFMVTYNDGKPNHSFNVGNNLDIVDELVQAITDMEALISGEGQDNAGELTFFKRGWGFPSSSFV